MRRISALVLIWSSLILLCGGCDGSSSQGVPGPDQHDDNQSGGGRSGGQGGPVLGGHPLLLTWLEDDLQDGALLGHAGETLSARVMVSWLRDGTPVPGAQVRFQIMDGEDWSGDALLMHNHSLTDRRGTASVRVYAGSTPSRYQIVARADGARDEPVEVEILPGGAPPITIGVNDRRSLYRGELQAELRIYDTTTSDSSTCQELGEAVLRGGLDLPGGRPVAISRSTSLPHEFRLEGLPASRPLSVLALGSLPPGHQSSQGHPHVSWRCAPLSTPPAGSQGAEVLLELEDLTPWYSRSYLLRSRFDLFDALPDLASQLVQHTTDFLDNPGATLVNSLGPIISDYLGIHIPAILLRPLEELIDRAIQSQLPEGFQRVALITGDLHDNLRALEMESRLELNDPPQKPPGQGDSGLLLFPPNSVQITWERINYRHYRQCADSSEPSSCPQSTLSFGALGLSKPQGSPEVAVGDLWNLTVEAHPVTIHWSELMVGILEKIIFPSLMGPEVDSIERLLLALLGGTSCLQEREGACCDRLVESIGLDSLLGGISSLLCEVAIPAAAEQARAFLMEGGSWSSGELRLGTADARAFSSLAPPEGPPHCQLFDTSGDWGVERLGKPGYACRWLGHVGTREGTDRTLLSGSFIGCNAPEVCEWEE